MKNVYLLLLLLVSQFLSKQIVNGQSYYRVSDKEKIVSSTLVVEGIVVKKQPFWNDRHTFIYTNNTIHIYKVFKGVTTSSEIEIVTQGGELDGYSVSATHVLSLNLNEIGLFCCFPNSQKLVSPTTRNVLLDVYSGAQGFLKYDLINYTANAPLSHYNNISDGLYKQIKQITSNEPIIKDASFSAKKSPSTVSTMGVNGLPVILAVPKIGSFTPDTVIAGATLNPSQNTLTVTGTGFGTNTGLASVWFDDTFDGQGGAKLYVDRNDPLLVSWSDTKIVVKVPSAAGTGRIWVENAAGVFDSTSKFIYIPYSVQTATYRSTSVTTKELSLMNHNGLGGYTFRFSTSHAGGGRDFDSAARTIFTRALTTWKNKVGFNAIIGKDTTLQLVSGDDINVVMFDNTNTGLSPLPAGTLGVTYYYATICNPVATSGYKKVGFDMVIRNAGVSLGSTNFSYGPCPPIVSPDSVYDIESTIFHEIGHAIGLAHVNDPQEGTKLPFINPGDVMNGGLSDGVRKISLDNGAVVGANYLITPKNNSYGGICFSSPATEMIPLRDSIINVANDEPPATFPTASIAPGTSVYFDLVNATSNKYKDPQPSAVNCTGQIMAITNNAYYALMTNAIGGNLDITVNGYKTSPDELAVCSASGVQLAIYQVNAAPKGHNYPLPIACRTFNGDSALTSISGLAANTNYLLFLEGIDNTKANFNLVLGGTALPIKIENFSGVSATGYNLLKWVINVDANIAKITVEKSSDGIQFSEYSTIGIDNLVNNIKDFTPFAGTSYYRLIVTHTDGTKAYSSVVAIKGSDKLMISVFPNPVINSINLRFSSVQNVGNVVIKVIDVLGQVVASKATTVSSGTSTLQIPVNKFAKGYYRVVVSDKDNSILQSINVEK